MNANLHQARLGVLRAIEARIELINASVGHNLVQGTANEDAVRQLVADTLPDRFGVGTGVIVGVDGRASRQVDIVVFDRTRANYLLHDDTRMFLADHVVAAIEIKTTFTAALLASALANIGSVKELAVSPQTWTRAETLPGTDQQVHVQYQGTPPLGIVFFFGTAETAGPMVLENHFSDLKRAIDEVDLASQPDFLCSLGHASLFRHRDVGVHTEETQEYSAVLVQLCSDAEQVMGLPADGKTKALVDLAASDRSEQEYPSVMAPNSTDTSRIRVVTGQHLTTLSVQYRLAEHGGQAYALDRHRCFLNFVHATELIISRKRLNPNWLASDYLGREFFSASVWPDDFNQYAQQLAAEPQDGGGGAPEA